MKTKRIPAKAFHVEFRPLDYLKGGKVVGHSHDASTGVCKSLVLMPVDWHGKSGVGCKCGKHP